MFRCVFNAFVGFAAVLLSGAAAYGQGVDPAALQRPKLDIVDLNGFSFMAGGFQVPEPSVQIGQSGLGGMSFQRIRQLGAWLPQNSQRVPGGRGWSKTLAGAILNCGVWNGNVISVTYNGVTETFNEALNGTITPREPSGASLTRLPGPGFLQWEHITSDGVRVVFGWRQQSPFDLDYNCLPSRAENPDGEVIEWNYAAFPNGISRLQSITNNLNYQIHFEYASNTPADLYNFTYLAKVTAFDRTLNPCAVTSYSCPDSVGGQWPYLTYAMVPGSPDERWLGLSEQVPGLG